MKNLKLFTLLFFTVSIYAQDIEWEKSYGGNQAEYLFDAIPTADYGFVLAGSSLSKKSGNKAEVGSGDLDFWVWKMDEKGDLDWQKSFGGSGSDMLMSIKNTYDGGFILAGTSNSSIGFDKNDAGFGGNDYWVIKLNAKGKQEWQKTFGGIGQDDLTGICLTADGGFVLGGSSNSTPSDSSSDRMEVEGFGNLELNMKSEDSRGNMDYWIVRLDKKGDVVWQKTYGGQYSDLLRVIEPTKEGGFIVGGYSNSPQSGDKSTGNFGVGGDYWILKLNEKGAIEWQQTIGGDKDDQLFSLQQTYDNGYIVGGNSNSGATNSKQKPNENGTDFWVLKLNNKGFIDWQTTYNYGEVDVLTSLVENADHSFLIGGYSPSPLVPEGGMGNGIVNGMKKRTSKKSAAVEGVDDFIALKISEKGEVLWDRTVGSAGEDILKKVIETRDGGYLMAGTSDPRKQDSSFGGMTGNGIAKKGLNAVSNGEQVAGLKKLNDAMDNKVNGATKDANDIYNKTMNNATSDVKNAIGLKEDSPLKIGGVGSDFLKTTNKGGLPGGVLGGGGAGAGQKPNLPASRDKTTNYGNKDFWVVKLKDKNKKVKAANKVEAIPNPVVNFTNIIVGYEFESGTATLVDMAGHVLQTIPVTSRTTPIDMSSYTEGIYVVNVTTNVSSDGVKIIKRGK